MKRFLLGFILAISIPAFAAVIWPSGVYLETFQNGFKFGTGKILSVLNDVITFDGKRLDDADKDIFFQEDFEGAAVSFTCDANIAAADDTGLMGSDTSKSFTQSTGAQDEVCSSANIPFAGAQEAKLCLVSSGSTNFDLKVYDVTNSTYLGTAPLRGNSNQDCVWFEGESSTANIRYDLVVRIEENTDELIIDNVQAKYFPFETGDINSNATIAYTGYLSTDGSGRVRFKTLDVDEGRGILSSDNSGTYTVITFNSDAEYTASSSLFGSGTSGYANLKLYDSSGTLKRDNYDQVGGSSVATVVASGKARQGDYLEVRVNTLTPTDSASSASFNVTAVAPKKSVTVKNTTSSDIASENNFDAVISSTGVVSGENYDWINGDCTESSGAYSCDINLTLSEPLICSSGKVQGANPGYDIFFNNAAGDINFVTKTTGGSAASAGPFNIRCTRRGTDFVKERDRVYTFAADSLTGNSCGLEGNDGRGITANTESVPFDGSCLGWTSGADGSTHSGGNYYEVQKNNSLVILTVAISTTAATSSQQVIVYKNGAEYKSLSPDGGSNIYSQGTYMSRRGEFAQGDKISFAYTDSGTLRDDNRLHYLNISEEYGDRGTFVGQFGQPTCFYRVNAPGNVSYSSEPGSTSYTQNNINRQEGSCDFSSVASDQITLKKGAYNYRIPIGANGNTGWIDARIYDGTTALKEHFDIVYHGGTGDVVPVNEIRDQLVLPNDTTIQIDTKNGSGASTMYVFDFEFTKVR